MADPKAIIRRLASLRTARQPHEAGWQECYDFTHPERGFGLNGGTTSVFTSEDAQTKRNRILDDTAADSSRILSASLVSGTTPANSLWFGLDAGQGAEDAGDDEEDIWLDQAGRTVFENIHASNFDAAAYECAVDIVDAGWFVLYIDEAKEGGYHFEQWPLAQCFASASRNGGLIDTIYREVSLTIEQLVEQYGIDSVSDSVKQSYAAEKFDEKVQIVHAIYPRSLYAVNGKRSKSLPFASCHVEVATNHLLKESGYHEFPCVVPRWMLIPGTDYATGPVSQALGSIRTINDIKALELANLDLATAGMWIAEDDGVLNPRTVKIGPRKIVVANSVDSMKALLPGSNFQVAFTAEDRLQAAIRKALLSDQLQPQDGPAMTATEVHVRVQLIRQLLGPIYGRLQAEYLQPLVIRCFGLAYRAGILGTAPEALRGSVFTVRFISPLARAQRMEDVTAMDRLETSLIAEAQADPTVLDVYDFEAAARLRGDFLGVPKTVLRSTADVLLLRDKRQAAAKTQQTQAMTQDVMAKAAPAMMQKAVGA